MPDDTMTAGNGADAIVETANPANEPGTVAGDMAELPTETAELSKAAMAAYQGMDEFLSALYDEGLTLVDLLKHVSKTGFGVHL